MDEEGQKYKVAYCSEKNTLKTETSNIVLNPSLHWKPVECSEQCCCTCMPGLTEDKVSNRKREWYIIARDVHRGKVREDLT